MMKRAMKQAVRSMARAVGAESRPRKWIWPAYYKI